MNNMTHKETMDYFDNNYDILFSGSINEGSKIYIGDNTNKKCRFCDKTSQETTFRTIAHAIPQSIGNRRIILNEECDECN